MRVDLSCTYRVHPEYLKSPYHAPMVLKHINLGLTAAQLRKLEKIAAKLNLDRTNAIRYCISRTAEVEGIK